MKKNRIYDMIVVGGGPAGYSTALYAARAGLDVLVLERLSPGGQMALSHQIDNYPGFEEGIDGFSLGQAMERQARRFGAQSRFAEVYSLQLEETPKVLQTSEGSFLARTVVLATGANPRPLGIREEAELVGRGVAYCAACDGMFYRDKTVAVVGGGNTAVADALLLSRIAKKVILIHRRDQLRATRLYHAALLEAPNVELRWNTTVTELLHDARLTGLRLQDRLTGEESLLECDGLFVSVGRIPATGFLSGSPILDREGYILADESTRTQLPGVFAAGDVRTKQVRQVVTAVADGAVAVHMAEAYLSEQKHP